MTTTYTSTSCNSEHTVACLGPLVSGEGLLHACISSTRMHFVYETFKRCTEFAEKIILKESIEHFCHIDF